MAADSIRFTAACISVFFCSFSNKCGGIYHRLLLLSGSREDGDL